MGKNIDWRAWVIVLILTSIVAIPVFLISSRQYQQFIVNLFGSMCVGLVVLAVAWLVLHLVWQNTNSRRRRRAKQTGKFLGPPGQPQCIITEIGGERATWHTCRIERALGYIAVYPQMWFARHVFTFNGSDLRWLGLPRRHSERRREIWLDLNTDARWITLGLRLRKSDLRNLLAHIETLAPDELLIERKRRRPNQRYGPVQASPATQDIYGVWTLDEPVTLYLTPLYLVVLEHGFVRREIVLDDVQEIEPLRRLDAVDAPGLVRFQVGTETMAFSLENHDAFAHALSNATHHDLEEPLAPKVKENWVYDEDFDSQEDRF